MSPGHFGVQRTVSPRPGRERVDRALYQAKQTVRDRTVSEFAPLAQSGATGMQSSQSNTPVLKSKLDCGP